MASSKSEHKCVEKAIKSFKKWLRAGSIIPYNWKKCQWMVHAVKCVPEGFPEANLLHYLSRGFESEVGTNAIRCVNCKSYARTFQALEGATYKWEFFWCDVCEKFCVFEL